MEAAKLKNYSLGDAARRLDCLAFRRALETGQTNRRNKNLVGHALNGHFQNPATPQSCSVAQISEMPAQCGRVVKPAVRRNKVTVPETFNDVPHGFRSRLQ